MRLCFENVMFERQCYDGGSSLLAREPWTFACKDAALAAEIERIMRGDRSGPDGFAGQFATFHDAIGSGDPMPVSLDDARRSIELASALYHAAETGQRVPLPLAASHPRYRGWLRL
jgi:predicted dehydrogenase